MSSGHKSRLPNRQPSHGLEVERLESRLAPAVPGNPTQIYVNQLYVDLLGRPADAVGLVAWPALLNQGISRGEVVRLIQNSAEYQTDEIQRLYKSLLHRDADALGLHDFGQFLAGGGRVEVVATIILGSPEYFQLHGNTNDGFLDGVYGDLLGRSVDAEGRVGWDLVLNGGVSRLEVASLIMNGPEDAKRQVDLLYEGILDRPPDAGGLAFWASVYQANGIVVVINGIASSDEYFAVAQRHPINIPGVTPTTTTVVSSANPAGLNQSVSFTATVTPNVAGPFTASGMVAFMDGSMTLAISPLNSGSSSFSTSTLPAGLTTITAVYSGDANFSTSSGTVIQTVNKAATTTALVSSVQPSFLNENVKFTATVTANAPGLISPSGTVTFLDGATVLGSATLNGGGFAALTSSGLSGGTHNIQAVYSGDASFASSTGSVSQVVTQVATATTLLSFAGTANAGQSVTFAAIVNPDTVGAFSATGTVTFMDGNTTLATASLSNGLAEVTTSALATGSHTISAVYGGDANFTGSSGTVMQTINASAKVVTALNLQSSAPASVVGQSVMFTATVQPSMSGAFTASGSVVFEDDGTTLTTAPLVGGVATFSTTSLSGGSHVISASYSGDANFNARRNLVTQTVNGTGTTTIVSGSVSTSTLNQQVLFTATVSPSTVGGVNATGNVTFSEGGSTLAVVQVSNGVAQFSTGLLPAGSHTITASYGGDSNFGPSSNTTNLTVNRASTTISVQASSGTSNLAQSVMFTATVVPSTLGTFDATGTVTFLDSGTTLTTIPLSGGMASFSTAGLSAGAHNITAVYAGNSNFSGSTSSGISHTVNQASTSTSVGSSINPAVTGQTVTITVTVSPSVQGSFNATGTVTLFVDNVSARAQTLSSGAVQFMISPSTGSHSVSAVYGGDSNFAGSTAPTITQQVINFTDSDGDGDTSISQDNSMFVSGHTEPDGV